MQPNTPDNRPVSGATPQDGSDDNHQIQVPARPGADQSAPSADQQAALNIMRDQISRIYDTNPPNQPNATQQPQEHQEPARPANTNPYQRTHDPIPHLSEQSDEWRQYHTAWQQYYQQYYQRFYMQQLEQQKKQTELHKKVAEATQGTAESTKKKRHRKSKADEYEIPESTGVLKEQITGTIKERATSIRKSHHFMPIVTAVVVGLLFLFVQFNRVMIAGVSAYVSPGSINPQNIILDPTANTKVSAEPKLIIPKLNVDAPIVYGIGSLQDGPVQQALKGGVVHYPLPGANSVPGQAGNTVILGHSSNDVFDAGKYKFVFVLLDRLEKGDTFYVHHEGTRYTYSVTDKKVITPNEIQALTIGNDKPIVSLVTCVPPGTALKRLIVFAEQVSPDPAKAAAAGEQNSSEPTAIPGNSKTFLERLFGG